METVINLEKTSGKYDEINEEILKTLDAFATMLIVIDGPKGHGFSLCSRSAYFHEGIPKLLRALADDIEKNETR